jgi:hypothetical protein
MTQLIYKLNFGWDRKTHRGLQTNVIMTGYIVFVTYFSLNRFYALLLMPFDLLFFIRMRGT